MVFNNDKKKLDDRSTKGKNWILVEPTILDLVEKVKESGIELENYVDGDINRGITTGLNSAFIIDEETKKQLINSHSSSESIIKPVLKGNDIRFYKIKYKNKYIIFARRGIKIDNYPAVKEYLAQHKESLMPKPNDWKGNNWKGRKPGSYEWYEIQDTTEYFEDFERPKIIYPDIAKESRFTFDKNDYYISNTAYYIASSDFYVLGILNSKLIFEYFKRVSSVLGDPDKGGRMRWTRQYVSKIPIVKASSSVRKQIESLVDQILTAKEDPEADTSELEAEIDQIVYKLYGLSEEEIGIVERNLI